MEMVDVRFASATLEAAGCASAPRSAPPPILDSATFRCSLRHGVTVSRLEIHAAPAAPTVELPVVGAPRCAAVDQSRLLNSPENRAELCIGDVESIVVAL